MAKHSWDSYILSSFETHLLLTTAETGTGIRGKQLHNYFVYTPEGHVRMLDSNVNLSTDASSHVKRLHS